MSVKDSIGDFRRVRVAGDSRQRGRQYGAAASAEIRESKQNYAAAFSSGAGLSWQEACNTAASFEEYLRAAVPDAYAEMRGISEGAYLPFLDILAMNLRTEIMWSAKLRGHMARECSSFALSRHRTEQGHLVIGQNWDWLKGGARSVIALEAEVAGGHNYVTFVEAGLLAKTGMNAAGVVVCTNALVSYNDRADLGIPYHVMLRELLTCTTVSEAVVRLQHAPRASSANYLVGAADGSVLDIEAAAGGPLELSVLFPDDGVLLHTNHFVEPPHDILDFSPQAMPDSLVRLQRARDWAAAKRSAITKADIVELCRDHANWPNSFCCHPDKHDPDPEQWATVLSVIYEPTLRTLHIATGNPCETDYLTVDYSDFLSGAEDTISA